MVILITGGSKCGKSSYAESLLDDYQGEKYYLATMEPYSDDAKTMIARHMKMRLDKGFTTIEKYCDIADINLPYKSAILLECIGNLCANEMFIDESIIDPTEKIIADIKALAKKVDMLVIVTNQVSSDGIEYGDGTMMYIKAIGLINQAIVKIADMVVECVCGIPNRLK